jgi:DNA-binding CsgD family transcriptional regulator
LLVLGASAARRQYRHAPAWNRIGRALRAILAHGGEVQWMPPNPFAPLSWLPEHASAVEIECARALIACAHAGSRNALPPNGRYPIAANAGVHKRGSGTCAKRSLLRLTLRQYEVLVLLSRGLSVKSISRQLRISVLTVKSHTLQLYRRLAAKNKSEAVFMAREKGAHWQPSRPIHDTRCRYRR